MRPLLLCIAALLLASPAQAGEERPTPGELEAELMCPTCQTTLDQSDSPVAREMKRFIAARVAAGDSKNEIKDRLVAEFGRSVLAAPPKEGFDLLAWILPLAGLLAGAGLVGTLAWRWSRAAAPGGTVGRPASAARHDVPSTSGGAFDAEL